VNDESERTYKGVVMDCFKMWFQYLPGGTERDHKKSIRIADY
jgi:hypothetical protein